MMKNILVPIGSTENAQSTLQYAIDFAAEIGANILVFRAYKAKSKAGIMVNVNAIIERETNLYLRAIVKSVDRKKVAIKFTKVITIGSKLIEKEDIFIKLSARDRSFIGPKETPLINE